MLGPMAKLQSRVKQVVEWLGLLLLLCVALIVAGIVGLRMTLGAGEPYPAPSTRPALPSSELATLVELPFPPGNVAVSASGRIFFNLHPFAKAERFGTASVFELVDGKPVPFPKGALQADLAGVLGMTVDRQDRLWLVRPASLEDMRTRLFAIDLKSGKRVMDYVFPDSTFPPFIQDLRVAPDGKTVYLADTGLMRLTPAALIVFDVARRSARRMLEGDPSVSAQGWKIVADGKPLQVLHGTLNFGAGVDGLTLSEDGATLYFAAMSNDTLYRVPTADLRAGLPDEQLSTRVEPVGNKPLSDGIERGADGQIYMTDVENGSVVRIDARGKLTTVISGPDMAWPDGLAMLPGGDVLVTDSRIPRFLDPMLAPPSRAAYPNE